MHARRKIAWLMIVAATAATAVDVAVAYPRLPPQVACHFDFHGDADAWGGKARFIAIMLTAACAMPLLAAVADLAIRRGPRTLIGLPNRDYWFAPEREASTRAGVAQFVLWLMAGTAVLLAYLAHESLAANFRQPPRIESMGIVLGGYVVFAALLIARLLLRYARPGDE